MAPPIVIKQRVVELAEQMLARQETPTTTNICDIICGGGFSTIKRYLDEWKIERT